MTPWLSWIAIVLVLLLPLFLFYFGIGCLFDAALKCYLLIFSNRGCDPYDFKLLKFLFGWQSTRHPLTRGLVEWRQFRAGAYKKELVLSDFTFKYLVHGEPQPNKPTIVLLHGFTAGKEEWSEVMRLLRPIAHVIAIDMPGHGETTRHPRGDHSIGGGIARVRQFIEALGIHKQGYHIVGSSWGGHIAGVYASKYPENLLSVSLMCPAGMEPKKTTRFVRALMEGRNLLLPDDSTQFQEFLGCVFHKPPPLPRWALAIGLRDRVPHYGFFETVFDQLMEPEQRFLLQKSMSEIRTPTLVLWGRDDQVLCSSGLEILKEGIENCEAYFLEECGHTISIEQAYPAVRYISDFVLRNHKQPNGVHIGNGFH